MVRTLSNGRGSLHRGFIDQTFCSIFHKLSKILSSAPSFDHYLPLSAIFFNRAITTIFRFETFIFFFQNGSVQWITPLMDLFRDRNWRLEGKRLFEKFLCNDLFPFDFDDQSIDASIDEFSRNKLES